MSVLGRLLTQANHTPQVRYTIGWNRVIVVVSIGSKYWKHGEKIWTRSQNLRIDLPVSYITPSCSFTILFKSKTKDTSLHSYYTTLLQTLQCLFSECLSKYNHLPKLIRYLNKWMSKYNMYNNLHQDTCTLPSISPAAIMVPSGLYPHAVTGVLPGFLSAGFITVFCTTVVVSQTRTVPSSEAVRHVLGSWGCQAPEVQLATWPLVFFMSLSKRYCTTLVFKWIFDLFGIQYS